MNGKNREYDNLIVIKYIGPKLQSWLREKLQVHTYQDLANLSVDHIQTQLLADKKTVATSKIEAWIKQAKELAIEAKTEDNTLPQVTELAKSGASERVGSQKKAKDWEEYASFMVYFEAREINGKRDKRVKVFHIEADKSKVWPELTAEHFVWMLDQAGEGPFSITSQQPSEEQSEMAKKQPVGEAQVKIKQVRLFQPPKAKKPVAISNGKIEQHTLKAGEPFSLEVLFSLVGEAAESVVEQHANYSVQIIANDTHKKVGTELGSVEPKALSKGKFEYKIRLPEATLDTGEHRLWAMVSVQATNTVPNFLEGPSVKVL